jgi:hypothetical protein
MKICQDCGKEFPFSIVIDGKKRNISNRKFCLACSPFGAHNTSKQSLRNRKKRKTRGEYHRKYMRRRVKLMKNKATDYAGNACFICGYSKCKDALEFHHRRPDQKNFGIGNRYACSWKVLKCEIDKCVLLCANCHREVEAGITKLISAVEVEGSIPSRGTKN